MSSALARGASSPKVRSIDRAARARMRSNVPAGVRTPTLCAVARAPGGLDAPMIAAAEKIRSSPVRSSRARRRANGTNTGAAVSPTHANPPNPTSSPPMKTRYVAVMSGSLAPGCPTREPSSSSTRSHNHSRDRAIEPCGWRARRRVGEARAVPRSFRRRSSRWFQ